MIRTAQYSKGDVIIAEGEYTFEVYVLERGRVEVYRAGPPEQRVSVLEPRAVFGEMAWITERPRSASVRALEAVQALVMDRADFLVLWRTKPDALLPVVRVLCERVRSLTALVDELRRRTGDAGEAVTAHVGDDVDVPMTTPAGLTVLVEGLTPQAVAALGHRTVEATRFPFRIGRHTHDDDPLCHNELSLPDQEPFHVSPSHCMLTVVGGRCFLLDRGSRLGTTVNGAVVAGGDRLGRAALREGVNECALGGVGTPFRFRLTVAPLA